MRWFQGSIPRAIAATKRINGIFIVFVYDKSESSKCSRETLNSDEIQAALSLSRFVAIQIENGSEEAEQFAKIYPLIVVPSIFFISGQSGVPLEVVGGKFEEKSLLEKIKRIEPLIDQDNQAVAEKTNGTTNNVASGASNIVASGTSSNVTSCNPLSLKEVAQHNVDKSQRNLASKSVQGNESTVSSSEEGALKPSSPDMPNKPEDKEDQVSLEERVAKAKALLNETQQLKIIKEQEEEKLKELERRRQSQDVVRAKQKKEELERAEMSRQRKKDKEEDRISRERVKAQIAADRTERLARESLLRGDPVPSQQPSPASPPLNVNPNRENVTRIKFRFPDNSSDLAQFSPTSTLENVRSYLTQNCSLTFSRFNLIATLPHRTFTEDQMSSTLSDLGLTPSAIIIVKPITGPAPGSLVPSGDGFLKIFWSLIAPVTFLLTYLRNLLGLGARQESVADSSDEDDSHAKKRPRRDPDMARHRPTTAYGNRQDTHLRREGNVHRLNRRGDDDDDDENNTWNGNSTQQM